MLTELDQLARLVKSLAAQRYLQAPSDVEFDDLVQEGWLGLLKASKEFDQARGVKLSAYAGHRVRGQMKDYLRTLGPSQLRGVEPPLYDQGTMNGFNYSLRWPPDVREALRNEVAKLPERSQHILEAIYARGLGYPETGKLVDLSRGQVNDLHRKTILLLRAKLRRFV